MHEDALGLGPDWHTTRPAPAQAEEPVVTDEDTPLEDAPPPQRPPPVEVKRAVAMSLAPARIDVRTFGAGARGVAQRCVGVGVEVDHRAVPSLVDGRWHSRSPQSVFALGQLTRLLAPTSINALEAAAIGPARLQQAK